MSRLSGTKPPARVTRLMRPAPVGPEHEALALQRRGPVRAREGVPTTAMSTTCCLRGGLEAGQAWLVLTTSARREEFARTLGPLHAAAVGSGRLVELDAYETLRKVTGPDGCLDPTRYEHVVGAVVGRLATAGTGVGVHPADCAAHGPVRADVFAADGSTAG